MVSNSNSTRSAGHGGDGRIGGGNQLGLFHSGDLLDLIVVVEIDIQIIRRVFQIALRTLIRTVRLYRFHPLDLAMVDALP